MAEKYFAELEGLWRQNKKTSPMRGYLKPPYPSWFQRPKSLRGADLVRELLWLGAVTGDRRFKDALIALGEHHIVDAKFNFLPWEMPFLAQERADFERETCETVHVLKTRHGASLRNACAVVAALLGWPATSFAAAIKDVELIYRRHLAKDGPQLPRTKLEKSCSTTIPTTANS